MAHAVFRDNCQKVLCVTDFKHGVVLFQIAPWRRGEDVGDYKARTCCRSSSTLSAEAGDSSCADGWNECPLEADLGDGQSAPLDRPLKDRYVSVSTFRQGNAWLIPNQAGFSSAGIELVDLYKLGQSKGVFYNRRLDVKEKWHDNR